MSKTKSELYELISDLMSRDDFEKEIKRRYETFGGLLNEEALAMLLVDELDRSAVENDSIQDMQDGDSVSLIVRVEEISEPREFKRKNGSSGRDSAQFLRPLFFGDR